MHPFSATSISFSLFMCPRPQGPGASSYLVSSSSSGTIWSRVLICPQISLHESLWVTVSSCESLRVPVSLCESPRVPQSPRESPRVPVGPCVSPWVLKMSPKGATTVPKGVTKVPERCPLGPFVQNVLSSKTTATWYRILVITTRSGL